MLVLMLKSSSTVSPAGGAVSLFCFFRVLRASSTFQLRWISAEKTASLDVGNSSHSVSAASISEGLKRSAKRVHIRAL